VSQPGKSYQHLVCALCGRPWAQCTRMVEGLKGALCIDCVAPTVSAFEGPDSLALSLRVLMDVLSHKNPKTPLPESRRLLDAVVALGGADPLMLRSAAWRAIRISHFDAAVEILERIADKDRVPSDAINAAFACYRLGRYQAGLTWLGGLDPAALDAVNRALYLLNHAALALEHEPEASAARLDELASRIEEARMLVLMLPIDADQQRRYLAGVAEGQARHAFRTGNPKRAIERSQDARKLADEPSTSALLLEGDAHAALGDHQAAHAVWLEALKAAHPECRDAQQARKRLTGVYR